MMDYTIGKKKFKLEKVSIYITEMYAELTNLAYGQSYLNDELEEIRLEFEIEKEEAESTVDVKRAELKRVRAIRQVNESVKNLVKDIFDKRFEILQEVLELNGYDFDRSYWSKNARVEDVNDILVDLIGNKKKAALSSD